MKYLWSTSYLIVLAGCSFHRPPPAPPLVAATPVEEPKPQPITPPQTATLIDELPPDVAQAMTKYMESGKAPLIDSAATGGFVRFPYGLWQAEVRCRPDSICDIELEPGEEVLDLAAADTVRWQFQPLREGPKDKRTVHVLVKPQDVVAMETGLVVGTDRRVYRIKIKSSPTAHVVNAKFYYPESLVQHFNEAQGQRQHEQEPVAAKLPSVSIEDLQQNYTVEGKAAFRPVWVASDESRTYLKMPVGLPTSGAPALFVEQGGTPELVNYTVKAGYYVVQGVPERIVLRRGVGSDAQEVTILRGK